MSTKKTKVQLTEELEVMCARVKSLEQAEETCKKLFETLPTGVCVIQDGVILYANSALAQILGEGPVNTSLFDHIAPNCHQKVKRIIEKCERGSTTETFETVGLRRDGIEFDLRVRIAGVERPEGMTIVGSCTDITGRERVEDGLRQERDRAQQYLDVAGVIFVAIDADQRVTLINDKGCEILGYTRDDIIGKNWFEMFIPDRIREEVQTTFNRLVTGEIEPVEYFENPVLTREGTERIIGWRNTLLRNSGGKIVGTLSAGEDITERKQADEVLANERALLRTIIDVLPVIVYAKDTACRKILTNHLDLKYMSASTEAEVIGKTDFDVYPEDIAAQFYAHDQKVIQTGQPLIGYDEPCIVTADGQQHWLLTSKVPLRNSAGQVIGLVGIGQDITERKRAEATLQRRAAQLSVLSDIGNQLMSVLALDMVLKQAVHLIHERFGYYHVAVFIIDHATNEIVMKAIAGSLADLFPPGHRLELGQGMVGWVARHGKPLLANDARAEPHYVNHYPDVISTLSELSVPIRGEQGVDGVIDIQSPRLDAFDENDGMVMEILAGQIAAAMANARLYETLQQELAEREQTEAALRKRNSEISRLYEVGKELGETLDEATIYQAVYRAVSASMACDEMLVLLIESDGKMLRCAYAWREGQTLDTGKFSPVPISSENDGLQDNIIWTGEAINIGDYRAHLANFREYYSISETAFGKKPASEYAECIRSSLIMPLKSGNSVPSLIQVNSNRHNAYTSDNLRFLTALASQVVTAILNAELFAKAQDEIFQRAQAEKALRESERFARSTLDGLSAHIAILDTTGAILAVNQAWRDFAQANPPVPSNVCEGANYLQTCDAATDPDAETARDIAGGIRDVLAGAIAQFEMEYPCHSDTEQRWFMARVTRFPGQGPARVVVAHENITRRKLSDIRLQEQLDFFQTLIDAIPNPVFYKDTNGQYLGCNTAYTTFRGRAALQIIGKTIYDMNDPSDIAALHAEVDAALLRNPGALVYETQGYHADETLHDIIVHKATFTDTDGNIDGVVGVLMDITDRKRIEAAEIEQRTLATALAETAAIINKSLNLDETFKSILSSLALVIPHDGANIMLIDRETGGVTLARYCECYALNALPFPNVAVAKSFEDLPSIAGIKRSGESLVIPDVTANPNWVPAPGADWVRSYVAAPICIEGDVIGLINVNSKAVGFFSRMHAERLQVFADQAAIAIHNATLYGEIQHHNTSLEQAIRQRTGELHQIKERVEAILTNTPDATLLLKKKGTIEICNLAFQRMFGYGADDLYGQPPVCLVVDSHAAQMQAALEQVRSERSPVRFEGIGRRKDGMTFDVDIAIAPIKANEELRGIVCSLRDISALKEVERMKDAFVSNVSHELRTPVANIKLNHKLLQMDPDHPDAYMERLGREIGRLNVIIEDLLRLSRLEQGQISLNLAPLDLNELVAQYVDDRTALAESKQLTLVFTPQPVLPSIQADEGLIGQVLSILMTNAFNYTPPGGRVSVSTQTEWLDDRQWVSFRVSDTGPGIPAAEASHLFERFFRGKTGRDSGAPGTGLGLSIAWEIVRRHQGKIELAKQPEDSTGATFYVWMPLEKSQPEKPASGRPAASK
ncbi:MAG: PAS domain S-box protein [Anaerolineae bacterium]|nr:PAS domain S-box protein [Anaerolineae bacterium]